MAAGGSGFGEGTPMGLRYRTVHEAPDLSAVPPLLRELVASCLEKQPGRRPAPAQLLGRLGESAGTATSYRLAPPRPATAPHVPTVTEAAADRGSGAPPAPKDEEAFVAADTDSSIVVDAGGILLTLHERGLPFDRIETDEDLDQGGEETELPWPQIADVAHRTVRRCRLQVAAALHDGSAFEGESNARRVSRVQQWPRGWRRPSRDT